MDAEPSSWFASPGHRDNPATETAWHMTAEVPEHIGTYAIDRVIARGPYGIVFKATDPLGLKVAIKWLSRRRDDAELDTIVQLSQTVKGMPPILGSGVLDDRTYFVMPYFDRRSLRFRLRSLSFPQPLPEVIRLAHACTEVLGELHRHGYTHFDFKPDNLLIEALPSASEHSEFSLVRLDERLVLTDFGTTRATDGEERFGDGTPGYAAPEMLFNVIDHDPRIDIYAASATLVECITGVAPSQVRNPSDSAFAAEVMSRIGPLEPTLRKGLSFSPAERPATMSQWFASLCDAAEVQQSFDAGRAPAGPNASSPQALPHATQPPIANVLSKPRRPGQPAGPDAGEALQRPITARRPVKPQRRTGVRRAARTSISVAASVLLIVAAYWGLTRAAERPSLVEFTQEGSSPASADAVDVTGDAPDGDDGSEAVDGGDGSGRVENADDYKINTEIEQSDWQRPQADPTLLISEPDLASGTLRQRLTTVTDGDGPSQSGGASHHRIVGHSRQVMSPNERWILSQRDDTWNVVDRSNGDFRYIRIGRQSSPTWHHSEPDTILHLAEGQLALLATVVGGQTTVVADLREQILAALPSAVELWAPDNGEPSSDGQRFAWVVLDDAADPIGFVTYDLSTGTMISLKQGLPEGDIGEFWSVAIAKSGERVVLAFDSGYIIYDLNFADEWRIDQYPHDHELALSANLNDVLVVANFDTGTFGTGWIVAHDLTDRSSTRLLDLYDNANTNMSFSGLATDRAGWVLASSYGCNATGAWSCDRIMALNIDDATIIELAQTNSCAESPNAVPQAVVNRDFSRAWFNTDFGSCGDDATIVELEIDEFVE